MPKKLEEKLKRQAKKKFPGNEERQDRYVYGTLRKTGWTPSHQKSVRGSKPFTPKEIEQGYRKL